MQWSGAKIFLPRGLHGIQQLVTKELKLAGLRERGGVLESLIDVHPVTKLRIPQSVWVPLTSGPVDSIAAAVQQLKSVPWDRIPALQSHGPRVSISSPLFGSKDKAGLLDQFKSIVGDRLVMNEFSIRIDAGNILSAQMNAIPPRPWIDTPAELTCQHAGGEWWSAGGQKESMGAAEPSEAPIRQFRNESSLACLCAGLVHISPLTNFLRAEDRESLLIWDPFGGNGAMMMEVLQLVSDNSVPDLTKDVTIAMNVRRECTGTVLERINRFCRSLDLQAEPLVAEPDVNQPTERSRGRKSTKLKGVVDEPPMPDAGEVAHRIKSVKLRMGATTVTVHVTSSPFQDMFRYMSGALILTHIPKTYTELLGVDKHELSEWTSFGNLLKANRGFTAFVFAETNSFFKYSKLKFAKLAHLVSPSGKGVASYSKWIGI